MKKITTVLVFLLVVTFSFGQWQSDFGIGVDIPLYKLDVDGDINISSGHNFLIDGTPFIQESQWFSPNDSTVYIEKNVGIFTNNPDSKLQVEGFRFGGPQGNLPTKNQTFAIGGVMSKIPKGDFGSSPEKDWAENGARRACPMIYSSMRYPDNGSGTFPFNQYGELMIQGTSHGINPAYGLYNMGISFVTWDGTNSDPTIKLRIKEDGNVGINTTEPNEKLEVNGNILIKNNNALILTSPNGTEYKITVDDSGNLITSVATSKKSITAETDVDIYPNPTNDQLTVKINDRLNKNIDAEIYTIGGKMIIMKNYNSNTFIINTIELKAGTYILKLKNENGNLLTTKKFIKQ